MFGPRVSGIALAFAAFLALSAAALAQDEARAIIAKALQAHGGVEKLSQIGATHSKIKGTLAEPKGGTIRGDVFEQLPDRHRFDLLTQIDGVAVFVIFTTKGPKTWMKIEGEATVEEATKKGALQSMHAAEVGSLLPLLREKRFTLTALGESKKDGQAVLGVKVKAKDQPDVSLFFDKAEGVLVRVEYRGHDDETGKEMDMASTLADFQEVELAGPEETALKSVRIGTSGPDLLEYVKKRTLSAATRERLAGLVRRLDSENFADREAASKELIQAGGIAVPFLQHAAKSADAETAQRAKHCLEQIKADTDTGTMTAVLRLIGLHRPAGATAVLLNYAPSVAADARLTRETRFALAAVAIRDGKPDEVLTRALDEKEVARRDAARAVHGKEGLELNQQPGRRLFLSGIKSATKMAQYRDGKKIVEWERNELLFFNKLDDTIFAKP